MVTVNISRILHPLNVHVLFMLAPAHLHTPEALCRGSCKPLVHSTDFPCISASHPSNLFSSQPCFQSFYPFMWKTKVLHRDSFHVCSLFVYLCVLLLICSRFPIRVFIPAFLSWKQACMHTCICTSKLVEQTDCCLLIFLDSERTKRQLKNQLQRPANESHSLPHQAQTSIDNSQS